MSVTNHPCDRYSCPEWNQGQCFGGGCRANPVPAYGGEYDHFEGGVSDADERELNDEWMGEEENQ